MVKTIKLSGKKCLAKTLKECGIDHVFYVTGGWVKLIPELDDLGIKTILCRNEKATCNMADGYSRVTNKPSVCWSQYGAAASILASMLYEPMYAHSPVIALNSSISTKEKDQWKYQECYEMPYFEATCKFSVDVTDLSRLSDYVRTAIQIAVSGCPGPTHVNMHNDMEGQITDMPLIYGDKTFFKVPPFRPRADQKRIYEGAKLLINSKKPVLACGSGIHFSEAYEELKELAELLTIPVATNLKGKGCFPEEHPLSLGVMGSYGREVANQIVRKADCVFFIATRAGRHMTEELTAPEHGKSKIIHLDIDPLVIGRNYKTDIALLGDAKSTLQELITVIKTIINKPKPKADRLQEIAKEIQRYESILNPLMEAENIPIKPQRIMKEIAKIMGPNDIIVSDTGQMLCWTSRLLKMKNSGINFIPCGGTMGSSFALAIGASFGAKKDQRVLNLIGDGGIAYNLAELETSRRYDNIHAPFVVLVNNNSSLSQIRPKLEDWSKKEPPKISCADLSELDYAKIARAFGCNGVRIEKPSEIAEALDEAFKSGKTTLIDVVTDKREYAPAGLARMLNKSPFPGVPPY